MRKKKMSVKDRISQTLLSILGEKKLAEIRISELTDRANVARASFYRNFNSFDEVLDYIADQYASKLNHLIIPMLEEKNYKVWYEEIHKVLTEIYESRASYTDYLTENLAVIFYKIQEKNRNIPNHEWNQSPLLKYEHISKVTAFYSVCMAWIRNGAKESIDDMTLFTLEKVLQIFNY